ncbi:MAG: hypothetical protein E7233_11890 [Lachnospiraceae bacterium]|nr:hypothetical protein [Lachnospiraceae bacterium]
MIFFRQDLYLGEGARKDKNIIIRNIRRHKLQFGVYVISLCANGRDILDIIPTFMLGRDDYKGRDITVLGIASGKDESFELAGKMIMDAYEATGGEDLRGYFA